jgi:hypothetical protein
VSATAHGAGPAPVRIKIRRYLEQAVLFTVMAGRASATAQIFSSFGLA